MRRSPIRVLGFGVEITPWTCAAMSGKAFNPNHEAFFVAFGSRVKQLRLSRGWSLRDMVVQHGYHASQWQVFEKGSNVTLDSVLRMATVFDLSVTELMGELGEFPRKYAGPAEKFGPALPSTAAKTPAKGQPARTSSKKTESK